MSRISWRGRGDAGEDCIVINVPELWEDGVHEAGRILGTREGDIAPLHVNYTTSPSPLIEP